MPLQLFRLAESLRALLRAGSPEEFEGHWTRHDVGSLGWHALHEAWRADARHGEEVAGEVDRLLLGLLARTPRWADRESEAARRVRTFRLAELERLQHASAAALVAQRFGPPGLRTVIEDRRAPLPRRYFSFVSLAERHPPRQWPLFAAFLSPRTHHAFLGVAVESARFYPTYTPTRDLVALFDRTREHLYLRTFLSPRILASLYALDDRGALPFFRGLLVSGYPDAEPEHCEVTRALVMVRRFTGQVAPSVKFGPGVAGSVVAAHLDRAEARYEAQREIIHPVVVI